MVKVSIIIPYFRNFLFFKKTIKSVLEQSYRNYEIIIIYDDAEKKELYLLQKLISKKTKIKLVINQKNIGAGPSRNKGIKIANGKYLAFIDSDDLWNKNKLKKQINFMEKKKINISHTSYLIINEDGQLLSSRLAKEELEYKELLNSCDIGLSTVILTKKLFDRYKFSKNITKEDYSLWLNISKKQTIYGLNQNLTKWRKTKKSLSSNLVQKLKDAYQIYHEQEKFNFLYSIYRTIILSVFYLKKTKLKN
ncbi:glycosyltransferase [Candidatus Pelagibacter sp.]|jgi:teichuronic acid biosynthesis glycosyltransferase TuaG|nr:glycosyltransferase [Candidatus Pelagibacter sp.]MDB4082171.1 glycosyltransferase [Candidatus Pelagibacter sp.]